MVTKFDIGDKVAIKGVVDYIAKLSDGIYYGIKDKDEEIIAVKENSLLKSEPSNNDFPCKIGDKFYWVDAITNELIEEICHGFRSIGGSIYIIDSSQNTYYIQNAYFSKEEAEEALKNEK